MASSMFAKNCFCASKEVVLPRNVRIQCSCLGLCAEDCPDVCPDTVVQPLDSRMGEPLRFVEDKCFPRIRGVLLDVVHVKGITSRPFCE